MMTQAPNLRRFDFVMNQHLEHAWRRARHEKHDAYLAVEREQRVFELVATCDPSQTGRYLGWLSRWRRRQWSTFGIRHVCSAWDLADAAKGLGSFDAIRSQLPQEHRDVSRYADPSELMRACFLLGRAEKSKLRDAQKTMAMAGSEILFDGAGWKLILLMSREAAVWWGMGTRWCTSGRGSNQFENYASRGYLYVLVTPKGRYQYHPATQEFRDAADVVASLSASLAMAPPGLTKRLASIQP